MFKKGQIVVFIGNKGVHPNGSDRFSGFSIGKEYIVDSANETSVQVLKDNNGSKNGWMSYYFKLKDLQRQTHMPEWF